MNRSFFSRINNSQDKVIPIIILVLFCFLKSSFGQKAKFYADMESVVPMLARNDSFLSGISWKIAGQIFTYGDDMIGVNTNPSKLDTIYYSSRYSTDYDTVLCNIKEEKTVILQYNPCCPFFNTRTTTGQKPIEKLHVEVVNKKRRKRYLIFFGSMYRELYSNRILEVNSTANGAVSSDIYRLRVFEVKKSNSEDDMEQGTAHFFDRNSEINYDPPAFSIVETIFDFNYIVLNNEVDTLVFDLEKRTVTVKE